MRPHPRTLRLLLAPAAVLLVLTGCGGSGGSGGSTSGSGESAESSESSESSEAEAAPELTAEDLGPRVLEAFQEAGTVRFALEQGIGDQTSSGTGEADLSGEALRSRAQIETPQGRVEAIAVDGLFYLKLPQVPGGKYLEVDPDDDSGLGALVGQLGGTSDPSKQLEVFGEATEVSAEGQEEVDGEETTKYRVVLPREALAESLGTDPQIVQALPEEIVYDVWVDAEDLIRKLVSEIEVQGQTSTTTVTYSDFGEPVDVQAPPAGQVTDRLPGTTP